MTASSTTDTCLDCQMSIEGKAHISAYRSTYFPGTILQSKEPDICTLPRRPRYWYDTYCCNCAKERGLFGLFDQNACNQCKYRDSKDKRAKKPAPVMAVKSVLKNVNQTAAPVRNQPAPAESSAVPAGAAPAKKSNESQSKKAPEKATSFKVKVKKSSKKKANKKAIKQATKKVPAAKAISATKLRNQPARAEASPVPAGATPAKKSNELRSKKPPKKVTGVKRTIDKSSKKNANNKAVKQATKKVPATKVFNKKAAAKMLKPKARERV